MDFESQRDEIHTELVSIRHNISAKKREVAVLEVREGCLQSRLFDVDAMELLRAKLGLEELLRMCRTPCRAFVPIDLDRFLAGKIRR